MEENKKFYTFEIHESDGNDNHISEFFVRANNADGAWAIVDSIVRAKLGGRITHESGDVDNWTIFYDVKDQCGEGEECRNERCGLDHRTHSVMFLLDSEDLSEEPEGSSSVWHPWEGEWVK